MPSEYEAPFAKLTLKTSIDDAEASFALLEFKLMELEFNEFELSLFDVLLFAAVLFVSVLLEVLLSSLSAVCTKKKGLKLSAVNSI